MLYQIHNGAVMYAAETILEHINFEIKDKEKIAVVGRNGCGKTTLLKLISGEVELAKQESDEDIFITKSGKPDIGYLKQIAFEDDSITLEEEIRKVFAPIIRMQERLEELLAEIEKNPDDRLVKEYTKLQEQFVQLNGYHYEREYQIIRREFGFTDEETKKPLSSFSGGQQTKIAFIKLLLRKPDILLLDEPTNHLDISTVEWLEGYIKNYPRAVVIVSHDRMFLDRIVDVVYEIEHHTAVRYVGNYSQFTETKKQNWEKQQKDYLAQQKEIARLTQLIDRFKNKPTKVAMTRSKLKQIEHMDKIEAPARYDVSTFYAHFEPKRESGKDVLFVKNLEIGYDRVLSSVSFEMKKGQRIGIVGSNGLGKSTLLKTLTGKLKPLSGNFSYGVNVDIAYFDQQMAQITSEKTVLDEFWDEFPRLTQTEVRSSLGAFLFTQDDVFKKVSVLSGGERVRLTLAKLLKRRPNFLILDEPTNHMDIIGKETLEALLREFSGTVLFVSHDRYFIRQVADSLLSFEEEGVHFYSFGYEEYLEARERKDIEEMTVREIKGQNLSGLSFGSSKTEPTAEGQKTGKNYSNPGKERAKRERKIKKLEIHIEELEAELAELKEEQTKPEYAADYIKLSEIQKTVEEKEEELENVMEEWSGISERNF